MAVRNGKVKKAPVLVRVVKFEIKPSEAQMSTLQKTSDNLRDIWNTALKSRQVFFHKNLKPLYKELRKASKDGNKDLVKKLKSDITEVYTKAPVYHVTGAPERSQASWLTKMRKEKSDYEAVPCMWQQETLKALEGSFKSFAQLRNKGDLTARPPLMKSEHAFCELQGLAGWKLIADGAGISPQKPVSSIQQKTLAESRLVSIRLAPGKGLPGGADITFPIPPYQQHILSQAVKLNKFTLYRDKKKRFWISIAYSMPIPDQVELIPERVVFLTLGASYIGVVSPLGEETINLWRSDKHWMPKIEAEKLRLKPKKVSNLSNFAFDDCQKGSRKWKQCTRNINTMYEKMRLQQLQHHREIIATKLKRHGVHFIVAEHSPIRGKKGRLANKKYSTRTGTLGLNWSVQNTGSLAQLRQLLEQKVAEWGGSVQSLRLENYPSGDARAKKIPAAKALRKQYLTA